MAIIGSNPALGRVQRLGATTETVDVASYGGIAGKSIYFVLLTFIAALTSFFGTVPLIETGNSGVVVGLLIGSAIVSIVSAFVAMLAPGTTKIAGSVYAIFEGFLVGFSSLMFAALGFQGEVFAALFATISVFAVMMVLYATGIIRVGSGFKKFMVSALIGLVLVNLIMWISSLFSPALYVIFYGNGFFSIIISVIMVIFASLMILFDLNRMTEIVTAGLGKKYEWIAAFGLLLTLVWLYLEFLRLFAKIASRKK